jgi:hypothetical protein
LQEESLLIQGDNVIYNQTEVREFHFVINGKLMGNRSVLDFEGFRCLVNCDLEEIEEAEISSDVQPWSLESSWPSGNVPVEGDDVTIDPEMNILFDLEESPLLKSLTINGRLSFNNSLE